MPTETGKPLIFISYAHEDEPEKPAEGEIKWLSFVTGYLRPAIKHGAVELWVDRLMPGGVGWEPEIEQKLRTCDIFMLLVSPNSLSSDYVVDREIAIIRKRQAKGEAVHFYPLVLTPTPKIALNLVRDRNLRPREAKPLSNYSLHDRYTHMNDAADEITALAERIAARLKPKSPASPRKSIALAIPRRGNHPVAFAAASASSEPPELGAIASIKDRKSFEEWLESQSRETAIIIAARAALRVAPLVGRAWSGLDTMTMAVFRAAALARAAGKYPPRSAELRAADSFAAARAAAGAATADAFATDAAAPFIAARAAFAAAARAAAEAAHAVADGAATMSATVSAVAAAAEADANATFFAATITAVAGDTFAALWAEVRADADALSHGDAAAQADRPLWWWSLGPPAWAVDHWATLQAALPKAEDWDVWIDWYEERLRGVPRGEAYDVAFAIVPVEEMERGPPAANAWIKAHLPNTP